METGIIEHVYDYLDAQIIALKSQLPTVLLKAEARGETGSTLLARLTPEELAEALRVNQGLIARHTERLAELESELAARQVPTQQVRPKGV